jgi:hypothetical protein
VNGAGELVGPTRAALEFVGADEDAQRPVRKAGEHARGGPGGDISHVVGLVVKVERVK